MSDKTLHLDSAGKKIVIFSDTHLTAKFDQAKFNFLADMIAKADRVIINGDFWDFGITSFNRFVNSQWQKLFPLLRSKGTIYLFGNHDFPEWSDERIELFSVKQGERCQLQTESYKLMIEHGHELTPSLELIWPKVFGRRAMVWLAYSINLLGFTVARNFYLKLFTVDNLRMKKIAHTRMEKMAHTLDLDKILVCGHSHRQEKSLTKKFINIGAVRWGLGQYLLVEGDKLTLVNDSY